MDKNKIDRWLRLAGYSEVTAKNYRWALRRVARFMAAKHIQFQDLKPEDLLDFLDRQNWGASMRSQCHLAVRAYARHYFGETHQIFELAVKKPRPTPQRTLNEEEVKKLLASIDLSGTNGPMRHAISIRNYALVTLMLDSGIRASEVCRLQLKHMDLDKRVFQVLTKGGKYKPKKYSVDAANYLEDWLVIREDYAAPGINNVFVGIKGTTPGQPFTRSGLRGVFKIMGKHAGIKGLSPHVLRRTFATLATIYGAPAIVLKKAGGWEDLKTMENYTQAVNPSEIEPYLPVPKLANRLEENVQNPESDRDSGTVFID